MPRSIAREIPGVSVSGTLETRQVYTPLFDVADVSSYFYNFGESATAMTPTSTYANNWGELVINAVGPLTVVNVATADFTSAWGVRVVGGGAVVVNVGGSSVSFASKTWTYQNGASNASTLLNMSQATTLTISGGHNVNILAANAATQFSSGTVTGNMIVGSLAGIGTVNWNSEGGFSGADYVPAPGGLAIFAVRIHRCSEAACSRECRQDDRFVSLPVPSPKLSTSHPMRSSSDM